MVFLKQTRARGILVDFLSPNNAVRHPYEWIVVDSKIPLPDCCPDRSDFARGISKQFSRYAGSMGYLDNSDAAGTGNFDLLDCYDLYLKKQIYKRLGQYNEFEYQNRAHCDYYARRKSITDDTVAPRRHSIPASDMGRLKASWNLLLSSNYRPGRLNCFMAGLWRRTLPTPTNRDHKSKFIFCRWNHFHHLASVAYTRIELERRINNSELKNFARVGSVSPSQYLSDLRSSHAVLSPFGYGELCYRDLEALALGAALLKPDVSHLETWPNLYIPHETYVPLPWDIDALVANLIQVTQNQDDLFRIGEAGRKAIAESWSNQGGEAFANHLNEIFAT